MSFVKMRTLVQVRWKDKAGFFLEQGAGPRDTLMLDSRPPELRE